MKTINITRYHTDLHWIAIREVYPICKYITYQMYLDTANLVSHDIA